VFHPSRGHTGVVLFGNLRGPADGLYEVSHRAQHVMSLRRAWR
jgi:hypothetical protein